MAPYEFRVNSWQRIPLDSQGSTTGRNALLVSLPFDRPLQVLVTHIDRKEPQRSAQLARVIDLFLALAPPAILMGDLNTTAADPQLKALLAAPGESMPWPAHPRAQDGSIGLSAAA